MLPIYLRMMRTITMNYDEEYKKAVENGATSVLEPELK